MSVRPEEVRHVAALARLALPADQVDGAARELGAILEYMELLAEVESEPDGDPGGAPEAAPSAPSARRADEPGECLSRDEALGSAPRADGETFLVPPVLDGGPGA